MNTGLVTSFFVTILVAGFSMGSWAGAAMAILVSITLGGLTILQVIGLLPPVMIAIPPGAQLTMTTFALAQVGLMI
jgi:hypothetical protein